MEAANAVSMALILDTAAKDNGASALLRDIVQHKDTLKLDSLMTPSLSRLHYGAVPEERSVLVKVLEASFATNEQRALEAFRRIQPNCAAETLYSKPQGVLVIFEDLLGFAVMSSELSCMRVDRPAITSLGRLLGVLHNGNHVAALGKEAFQQLLATHSNHELLTASAAETFDEPFATESIGFQRSLEGETVARADKVFANQQLASAAQNLKQVFLDKKECLLHGNLGAENVLVNTGQVRLANLERAVVGPCSYDLGVLLANFMMFYHAHMLTPEDNDLHRQVSYKMVEACSTVADMYLGEMRATVGADREQYVASLMSEVAGFAGVELVRMVLGRRQPGMVRASASAQTEVLESGVRLMGAYHRIHDVSRLTMIGLTLC